LLYRLKDSTRRQFNFLVSKQWTAYPIEGQQKSEKHKD
jgi:hypothetical protein